MTAKTILTGLVAACVALAGIVWLGPVYRDNRRTREALRRLQTNLEQQNHDIDLLNRELTKLRTDCRAIERVAREKFGLCRDDERIYHFEMPVGPAEAEKLTDPALDPSGRVETSPL